jgi:hypothetical protein
LIGHSLGARVVLSALQSLHNNQEWKNEKFKVTSVHLLGGDVDNEEVSKDSWDIVSDPTNFNGTFSIKFPYGNAIQDEVAKFYNLFDSADAALIALFPSAEHDNPLGLKGAQIGISLPSNYNQKDVKNMIPPFCDANGDKRADLPFHREDKVTIGQNHAGYYGFRNPADNKTLIDSGAMNTVVRDWNITLAAQKLSLSPSAICNSTG